MLLLLVLAIFLGALASLMERRGLEWASRISEVASFAVALAGLFLPVVPRLTAMLRGRRPPTPRQVREARGALAAALSEAWDGQETPESQLLHGSSMRVRFVLHDETVASGDTAISFAQVRESFSAEPRYRRVVLGKPGAGKTVLVCELAKQL